jgi:hypothetical protein
MNLRVTVATSASVLLLAATAACGGSDAPAGGPEPSDSPSAAVPTTQAPSVDPTTEGAIAVRGDWEIPSEEYVLHLIEDGTFLEDFEGIRDFRTGKYEVDGDTLRLIGDDGNTDEGKIAGDVIEFKLGKATRIK